MHEITLKAYVSFDELIRELERQGFKLKESFSLKDSYYVPDHWDTKAMMGLELYAKTVILREYDAGQCRLLIKEKVYDEHEHILSQKESVNEIGNFEETETVLKEQGYRLWKQMKDDCFIYDDQKIKLIVQKLANDLVFVEFEAEARDEGHHFDSVEEMTEVLRTYHLSLDFSDCFVRKIEFIDAF